MLGALGVNVDPEGSSRRFFQGFSTVLPEGPPNCLDGRRLRVDWRPSAEALPPVAEPRFVGFRPFRVRREFFDRFVDFRPFRARRATRFVFY